MSTYSNRIVSIIRAINPIEDVHEDTQLIESGIIDSLSLMILIAHVEESFGIEIDGCEYVPENFESVSAIESLIRRLESNIQ